MTITERETGASIRPEAIPVQAIDHLEFWVGNARQAAYFYQQACGFTLAGYRGPETGCRDSASYLLVQGKIRLVLTTGLTPDHPACTHVRLHGDGVRDVALTVPDAREAYQLATTRGAQGLEEPHVLQDEQGKVLLSAIATYGDTRHTFIERTGFQGTFLPGFVPCPTATLLPGPDVGLVSIDHVVGNVGWNQMDEWVGFYQRVFGFHPFISFDDQDISTEFSALRSVVMASPDERIKFPINEPAQGRKQSQIEEYLKAYGSPGVQHIALLTGDILKTVAALRDRGIGFLQVPDTYYQHLSDRTDGLKEDLEALRALNILVDRDEHGYMLQIFTRPMQDRPTLFLEIIQRRGGRSFGKGNFKALFEAIEREQALRGNL